MILQCSACVDLLTIFVLRGACLDLLILIVQCSACVDLLIIFVLRGACLDLLIYDRQLRAEQDVAEMRVTGLPRRPLHHRLICAEEVMSRYVTLRTALAADCEPEQAEQAAVHRHVAAGAATVLRRLPHGDVRIGAGTLPLHSSHRHEEFAAP